VSRMKPTILLRIALALLSLVVFIFRLFRN
jgi:hypothetical protein